MNIFEQNALNNELMRAITDLGFVTPTPIQEKTIPEILNSDSDLIALAQTGTGKTAGFGLPILHKLNSSINAVQAIILSPTRELALQITNDLNSFAKYMKNINIVPVYGGASIITQIASLRRGAQIVVGTPGRTLDLIKRNVLKINNIRWLVLDEADEMLNMGFRDELDSILENTPKEKQTLLFSATMPEGVKRISENYLTDPVEISAGKVNIGAENVSHQYFVVKATDRYLALKRIADINPNIYALVFCRTREETKEVASKMIDDGYNADALHGDLSQAQRDYVMQRFRNKQLQMLVATDVAARGLDINDLTHVINYNLPDDPEVYIHRSGRTGRAGKLGISMIISHTREGMRLRTLERLVGQKFEYKPVPNGQEICEKRLLSLMENIENIEVNEVKIAPFMDTIREKFQHLEKEEILKRFVSVEFNRFLDYYKKATDLNVKPENSKRDRDRDRDRNDRNDRNDRRERRDRNDRPERNDRTERTDRPVNERTERVERTDRPEKTDRPERYERGDRPERFSNKNFVRLYVNIGAKNNLKAPNLMGLVNELTNSRNIEFGKIDIQRSFSFFEVEKGTEQQVLDAFEGKSYGSVQLLIEVARPDNFIDKKKEFRNNDISKRNFRNEGEKRDYKKRDFGKKPPRKENEKRRKY
jgi:ATP-dependent RNA helicase DeaD